MEFMRENKPINRRCSHQPINDRQLANQSTTDSSALWQQHSHSTHQNLSPSRHPREDASTPLCSVQHISRNSQKTKDWSANMQIMFLSRVRNRGPQHHHPIKPLQPRRSCGYRCFGRKGYSPSTLSVSMHFVYSHIFRLHRTGICHENIK